MIFGPAIRRSLFLSSVVALAGCGSSRLPAPDEYNDPKYKAPVQGSLSSSNGTLFSTAKPADDAQQGGGIGVNAYLWRGALDTLSFMPLASADPFGGVIITDWYQPPAAQGDRFKATAYILGRQLRADGIRISVFRQTLQNGQWVDQAVAPGTASELENKVLARARELRSQAAAK